ncbi:MAG: hypothetical protein ABIH86_05525 [Planctomycetota bacterium]
MSDQQTVRCNHCGKTVGYHFDPINHKKNLFLTIVSFGLWLPIWLSMAFSPTKICNECKKPIWETK